MKHKFELDRVKEIQVENPDGSISECGIEWLKELKKDWEVALLYEILDCLENPQHKYHSKPKKYIKKLLIN